MHERMRMPVDEMNETVLRAVEEHALTPEAIEQVIRLSERDDAQERQMALAREALDTDKRLADALEEGGEVATLIGRIRELELKREQIGAELRSLQPIPRLERSVIEDRLTEWRRLLRQSTTQGRAVLQRILRGRLVFTPRIEPIPEFAAAVSGRPTTFVVPHDSTSCFKGSSKDGRRSSTPTI